MTPVISIIFPAFNSASFIKEAIDSLLQQTFMDFELIIINDGSTDNTEAIVQSYTDSRIVYSKNETNQGLIYTLNKGIKMARGAYIARMDADDICLPNRLAVQKQWLDSHPETAVVATLIEFIDENNTVTGYWKLDKLTITFAAIRKVMPYENCIAHPSVMARKSILETYLYNPEQQHIEDYDLWLRLIADGHRIEKIPQVLLQYRVHSSSITVSKLRKNNFFFKHYAFKKRYIASRIKAKKFNAFDVSVSLQMTLDLIRGAGKEIKKALKKT
ncbi:MAG TPA: glycosyltransferase [Flavisolibacter sp.]|nr:glycosyltransferase [Flavisolibacter sp.]